ncbi:hypothetical protein J3A83DRAFT_4087792 [Scleroderma citrinum]
MLFVQLAAVEFYFADSNLPFDKFMWTLHTANPEHWVPIKTVTSFRRMRDHAAQGHEFIQRALRESTELEVDDAGVNVRRRTEVAPPKDQFERSVYAKGFGAEDPGMQKMLEEFFSKYGNTNAVRMRRVEGNKEFKGSVFVEFTDASSVDAFLNADPKPSWNGEELLIMTKEAYCDMKIKEKGLTGKAAEIRKEKINRKGFNAFREMENGSRAKSNGRTKEKPEVYLEFMGSKIRVYDEDGVGHVKEEDVPFVKGATLKFMGCGGDANFTEMKAPLRERFTRVPYIQFTKGDDYGLVGFDKVLTDDEIAYVRDNLKTVNSKEVEWIIPDGMLLLSLFPEEERAFQIDRADFAARSALSRSQIRKGPSSRGGRGGGRGRGRGRGRGGRPTGRSGETDKVKSNKGKSTDEEQAGEKRKRAIEPDGGPDVGVRGATVPTIMTTKKVKTDES